MKIRYLFLSVFFFFANGFAYAGISDWIYGRSWEFMESVGGIAVGTPARNPSGSVYLPVKCDVSGLTTITKKSTLINSALVVNGVNKNVQNDEIQISVDTGLIWIESKTSNCIDVELGDIPAGEYKVFYLGSDREKHSLGNVVVPAR